MCAMDHSIDKTDTPTSDSRPKKQQRKKSMVWDHFTIETVGDREKATCNHCKKQFAYISGSKQAGTSHLKRHIALGICPVGREVQEKKEPMTVSPPLKQSIPLDSNLTRKRCRAANQTPRPYLKGDRYRHNNLARMIIQHDYPVDMVEQPGFIDFVRTLNPNLSLTSAGTVQEQIVEIYLKEKQKLMDALSSMSGHLSLALDLWTSNQGVPYVLTTGHFVDQDWNLQRRILNFIPVKALDSSLAFSEAVTSCLSDWKSEDKLLSVSIDRCSTNESSVENIRSLLSIKNSLILNGQLLLKDCYSCVLRNLALGALEYIKGTVEKVRYSVKYVKASKVHEENFMELKQKLQVPSLKTPVIDDLARWDSTYLMLVSASELKEVFSCMDTYEDTEYKSTISSEEWESVETVCTYLKIFHNAARILSLPEYPTTNVFFHEVLNIHLALTNAASRPDPFISSLAKPLHERFVKYWEDCYQVLAAAVAMDPRFKMRLVEFSFSRIYGDSFAPYMNSVNDGLHELYLEYVVQALPPPTFVQKETDPPEKTEVLEADNPVENGAPKVDDHLVYQDFDIYITDFTVEQQLKSELDQYLEEPILPRTQDFDVLGWWKSHSPRYPTLSKLAVDVLSIPVSTVLGEAVFDTRPRRLSNHRSALSGSTLQALVCAKDWLRHEAALDSIPFRD